mgnify:CR=1 FL=1
MDVIDKNQIKKNPEVYQSIPCGYFTIINLILEKNAKLKTYGQCHLKNVFWENLSKQLILLYGVYIYMIKTVKHDNWPTITYGY